MNLLVITVLVVIADQLSKCFVAAHFSLGESVPVVQGVFHWTYILNSGAAFGMLAGSRWLFMAIAVAVAAGMWYLRRSILAAGKMCQLGTAFFCGGAVGNLIDRALKGAVTDFFDFRIWPVFNVADIAICVGVGLIIWNIFRTEWQAGSNS